MLQLICQTAGGGPANSGSQRHFKRELKHAFLEGEREGGSEEGKNGTMLLLDSNTGSHVKQLIESAFHRGHETRRLFSIRDQASPTVLTDGCLEINTDGCALYRLTSLLVTISICLSLALALSDTVTENKDGRCGEKNLENIPDDYGKQG